MNTRQSVHNGMMRRKSPFYRIFIWMALLTSLVTLWVLSSRILIQPGWIMNQDFAQFWAAGRLNLSGENPYDPARVQFLKEQIAGEAKQKPQVITIFYSPPWAIPIAMAFGVFAYLPSRLLWLVGNILIMVLSVKVLWRLYNGSDQSIWLTWLLVFTLGPTYLVLVQGQITPLVLLGISGFLYFTNIKENDWLAGSSAFLISLKPQLFYLFWVALFLWTIINRRWKVLAGVILTLGCATIISLAFNPNLIDNYYESLLFNIPLEWFTPTIGALLRIVFGEEYFWLQFIPVAIGLIWFAWYWRRHKANWSWTLTMPELVLVSLITTFYAWTYDHILVIVALVPAWIILTNFKARLLPTVLLGIFIVVNILYTVMHRFFVDGYLIWFTPTLILWCWIVQQLSKARQPSMSTPNQGRNFPG